MGKTYRAILDGDRLHWLGEAPSTAGPTEVGVNIEEPAGGDVDPQGAIDVLERLAAEGGVRSIPDPVAWQREIRKDRPLPGRD